MQRLQKKMASANVASRRESEEMIKAGRVKVNGKVVTEMGIMVGDADTILVDDQPITKSDLVYFLMNKPTGFITTTSDPKGRKTVLNLLRPEDMKRRVYPVGRLDYDTAGLLLLTNDGNITYILTRPEYGVEKEYIVRVEGIVIRQKIRDLRKGIQLETHYSKPNFIRIVELDKSNKTTLISVILTEGKNHEVRNIFEAIGHPVKTLTRVRIGTLTLDGIARGEYRELSIHEVRKLYAYEKAVKK